MKHFSLLILLAALPTHASGTSPAFGPGEQSTYRVSWLGLPAGEAQITVGAPTRIDGTPVWPIVVTARTTSVAAAFPVKDKFVTWWDDAAGRTLGNEFWVDEFKSRRRERIRFTGGEGAAFVTRQKEGEAQRESEWTVDPSTLDVAAAAMALRKTTLIEGAEVRFPVFTGTQNLQLSATVGGRSTLDTPLGPREVWKLKVRTGFAGQLAAKRDVLLYLSADRQQVPVRVEADFLLGTVVAELVQYAAGQEGVEHN